MTRVTTMVWLVTESQTSLECEVKQALENITMNKASWADRIPAAPF